MALPRPTHVYQEGAAVEPGRAARCALALGEASNGPTARNIGPWRLRSNNRPAPVSFIESSRNAIHWAHRPRQRPCL